MQKTNNIHTLSNVHSKKMGRNKKNILGQRMQINKMMTCT